MLCLCEGPEERLQNIEQASEPNGVSRSSIAFMGATGTTVITAGGGKIVDINANGISFAAPGVNVYSDGGGVTAVVYGNGNGGSTALAVRINLVGNCLQQRATFI